MALNQQNILKEITNIDRQIQDYENKAAYLQKIEKQIINLQYASFHEQVSEIRKYLKDLKSITKIK